MKNTQIKVIALDLDGTLLTSDKTISKKTKDALIEVQQKGIKIILATGRPTSGVYQYAKELLLDQYDGLIISYNGSLVLDFSTNETIFAQQLSCHDARNIIAHLKDFDVNPMITKDQILYTENKNGYKVQYEAMINQLDIIEVEHLVDILDFDVYKVLMSGDETYLLQNYKAIQEPFSEHFNTMFSTKFFFEITPQNIDKAKSLEVALQYLHLDKSNLMAFGDGLNDLSMIQYAHIGVAMENAEEALKKVADYTTTHHDQDGIYEALSKFVF